MPHQTITRKGSFDSGHRVLHERFKCFNIHGHTYTYELEFGFERQERIGYAIDFKELKRVGCQWIDDMLDHGMILNPEDREMIETSERLQSKLWLMSLNGTSYCNPTVENIAKEIFLAMEVLFSDYESLGIHSVTLHETPNCFTRCQNESIAEDERQNFLSARGTELSGYAEKKGMVEYDTGNEADRS